MKTAEELKIIIEKSRHEAADCYSSPEVLDWIDWFEKELLDLKKVNKVEKMNDDIFSVNFSEFTKEELLNKLDQEIDTTEDVRKLRILLRMLIRIMQSKKITPFKKVYGDSVIINLENKGSYYLQHEDMTNDERSDGRIHIMKCALNKKGDYIGDEKAAEYYTNLGIDPELADPKDKTCSIGFSTIDNKWYGWSHRAMFGFAIGHVVKEGNCEASSGLIDSYLKDHPEEDCSMVIGFECKTLEDCKKCAIAFADSVS